MRIDDTKEGCILNISVRPRSNEFSIVVQGDDIVVYCREEPVRGKVNQELVKELSKLFRKKVELVSGFSSKEKRLLVRGGKKSEIKGYIKPE